ncbi:MAG TPA: MarR family transcriptional regulator [Gemmatimonadales bacterium]|jgi:DNA-binding MarR family transcriptional regulator|nr:MarR family transcriptional regulator [Gemmatimonadales bacterium]
MVSRLLAEIKQTKPFARPGEEALVSILRTAAVVEHEINDVLKPFDLTSTQYNVLRILRGAGSTGLCGREVGERLITQVPDVPRLLDRMTDAGLIARERDPADRRHVTARITPKGLRLLDDAEPALSAIERRRMGSLRPDDIQALLRHLEAVRSGT